MNILFTAAMAVGALTTSLSDPFTQTFDSKVVDIIENSEQYKSLKPGLLERWNELVEQGVLEVSGTDEEVRPYFVSLQGIVEHVLATELNHSVKSLIGVIHTPMPATPLCTDGAVSEELVSTSVLQDPMRLFTVKARTTIVRDYLHQGGNLYIAYPKAGIARRTASQQEIYRKELANYPLCLHDYPLECESIQDDLIGATYVFTDQEGNAFAFAIKMTQANSPQDKGHFGLWFGDAQNSPVHERIQDVSQNVLIHCKEPIQLLFKQPV
ncbi:MAG: hypothetical protein JSS61_06675 [Verrucomicrobia bacterium]|nr:hypothetical protein [Verrucomicrobiota bacterium]